MIAAILVFLGGGTGSICRYFLSRHLNAGSPDGIQFPWGTFLANIISCLVLGLLIEWLVRNPERETYRLLFITGFCGGFSTFSSFIWEWLEYMRNQMYVDGALYIGLSLIAGLLSILTGIYLYKSVIA